MFPGEEAIWKKMLINRICCLRKYTRIFNIFCYMVVISPSNIGNYHDISSLHLAILIFRCTDTALFISIGSVSLYLSSLIQCLSVRILALVWFPLCLSALARYVSTYHRWYGTALFIIYALVRYEYVHTYISICSKR